MRLWGIFGAGLRVTEESEDEKRKGSFKKGFLFAEMDGSISFGGADDRDDPVRGAG